MNAETRDADNETREDYNSNFPEQIETNLKIKWTQYSKFNLWF
jgi:hypothetical protein